MSAITRSSYLNNEKYSELKGMKPERKPTNLQDLRNKEQNGLKSMDHNRQLNAQKKNVLC